MNKKFVTLFLVVIILIFASAENVAREKILTDCIEMVINGVKNGYVRDNDNLIYVLEKCATILRSKWEN